MSAFPPNDELLIRLLQRHFADPAAALLRFDKHLAKVSLPFELRAQLRELSYPSMPQFPNGLPSFIYYYLPDTGWGSTNQWPANPTDRNFVYSSDGIGLNLGCPVRLLRALDALSLLPSNDLKEAREGLASSKKHLATVEELLWLTVWKSPSDQRRGGALPGANGNVDWSLKARGCPVYLEAKFRQSDWPRLSDQGTFLPITGSFLGKAGHKFPNPPHEAAFYLVGITAFDNISKDLLHLIGKELEAHPQIHAVVFRSFIQMTHVLSLDERVMKHLTGLLAVSSTKDFPLNYILPFHIQQRDQRVAATVQLNTPPPTSSVLCNGVQPRFDEPIPIPEPGIYRMNILSRGPDGEPRFQVVPKYLWRGPHARNK